MIQTRYDVCSEANEHEHSPHCEEEQPECDFFSKYRSVFFQKKIPTKLILGMSILFVKNLNRMIDGSCNNQINTILGKIKTPFLRLMPNAYNDRCSVPRGGQINSQLPSPRMISRNIITTFERVSE